MKSYYEYSITLIIISSILSNNTFEEEPLRCPINKSTKRIGIFAVRDVIATIISGSITGQLIEKKPVKGIIVFFCAAPLIHKIFKVRTAFNHSIGLSKSPNGTGKIPLCIV